MDVYEATRIVLSRIQNLDPANASKIIGLLLLQDHGEKEMIRLAFGPQNLLHSVIAKAKKDLEERLSFLTPRTAEDFESDLGFGWGHRKEVLRSNSVPPRLANQFTGYPFSPKGVNLQQSEAQRAAALMMGDDLHKLGIWRPERIDLSATACPASRQIYLTFPADSIFREEDVSDYFSTFGPVQDVRIPYQQKRMFGFVTFMYPETVKSILAKGNPHFVCHSRVLVKPYKEKGKVPDKTKPSRDIMDFQLGGRAFHEDLLWKRRFEERALELQSTRLMNLQLLDVEKQFQLNFDQTLLVSPRLVSNNQRVCTKENDEDTIKLPESLEDDRLVDSPIVSPKHHFLECGVAAETKGSGLSSPSFDQDESSTGTLKEPLKSLKCQMPRLSMMGITQGSSGPTTCRVGI
ncbi:RNA-binding (RRM/RBD/RNP motifs) family protein [Arabidopsis thaliana]|uniref:At3g63450 n=1 Tax=Arabidopsis thaliana TaxID=3702 RepID=Q6NKZ1_ARATH|nr:RNA-binding (RRM/RBD/RNP motifs) family protein [Arabidopsis thaliana]NP_191904.2 RNA-binding (RRM/RBD/RNP motifs) family protein [Arabidopsis thaliana]AAS99696.1 At3g63450 [Arabidopsis thaliana]AEE80483.1 RNA-binding (RRM/RBD/RNP motifs) family protein [Arabidopsis thaliana]AEE80484.1 RNA-binding (RRM/RBD/RNP motifs) family protein [Arabidopsis thaliana]|eukprot:NP_001030921.1 RNA-binding (RRM/RBD/RNP motifs) family protein [Arabidopsis thaliana]